MKQKTKSKFLTTLNIILLVLLFAIPAAAYWAGAIGGANKETTAVIEIGEGQNAETTITLTDYETEGVLVPEGRAVAGQVEEINFNLTFVWTETTDGLVNGATGNFNLETKPSHTLLNFTLTSVPETVKLGETYTINVTVTLDEPETKDKYDELQEAANQGLTILFNMKITNVTPN